MQTIFTARLNGSKWIKRTCYPAGYYKLHRTSSLRQNLRTIRAIFFLLFDLAYTFWSEFTCLKIERLLEFISVFYNFIYERFYLSDGGTSQVNSIR